MNSAFIIHSLFIVVIIQCITIITIQLCTLNYYHNEKRYTLQSMPLKAMLIYNILGFAEAPEPDRYCEALRNCPRTVQHASFDHSHVQILIVLAECGLQTHTQTFQHMM